MAEQNGSGRRGYGKHGRCTARARSNGGERCRQPAANESGKCRFHGGMSLRGPDHPRWKDGKRSRFMPKFMDEVFRERLDDEQLLSIEEEIRAERALRNAALNILREMEEEPLPDTLKAALKKSGETRKWYAQAEQANANLAKLKALRQQMVIQNHATATPQEFRAAYMMMLDAVRSGVQEFLPEPEAMKCLSRIDNEIREIAGS